jgi:hypothetical protein
LTFVVADLKTDYLLASLLPFLVLPVFALFHSISSQKAILLCVAIVVSFPFTASRIDWWSPNEPQLKVVRTLSEILQNHPNASYFDGIGILPRSPQLLAYIGPADDVGNLSAIEKATKQRPDLILYTSRTALLGQGFVDFLLSQYREIGANLYLRKDLDWKLKVDFPAPPVFLFQTNPREFNQ